MDFGDAIKLLKEGKKLQRSGWNGKNQYIEADGSIDNKAIAFIGTSGVQMAWLASQDDMLADDWKVVE